MADKEAVDVFAIPDFWKCSEWLDTSDKRSEFFDLDAKKSENSSVNQLIPTTVNSASNEIFKTPAEFQPLGIKGHPETTHDETASERPRKVARRDVDFFSDAWMRKEEAPFYHAELKTWDGFNMPDIPTVPALFVTEAGPTTYDEILRSPADPLGVRNTDYNVIKVHPYTVSLLALALGRTSVFFTWDEKKASFTPELNKMRVSGYSAGVLRGFEDLCLECGNITRFLSDFVRITYKIHPSPGKVALAKTVDDVLLVIQTKLGSHASLIKSLLQLQSIIQPVYSVLLYFKSLIAKLNKARTDEHLLSVLFEETQALEHGDGLLSEIIREVLMRACAPWTDFAQEWIGVKTETGIKITKESPGKSFVRVENVVFVDDFGLELEGPDYVLDQDRMPSFVPEDVARVMFETGRNLRLLRTHHPEHPLCFMEHLRPTEPPAFEWNFDWGSILKSQKEVDDYEASLLQVIRHQPYETVRHSHASMTVQPSTHVGYEFKLFGGEESQLENQLLASIKQLNQPIPATIEEDRLSRLLQDAFDGRQRTSNTGIDLTPHWSLLPLLSFGPLVEAQARLVNREYMKLLFSAHDLRTHITLQRQFQLLGNGFFCSRLSHSLFDPELETAERQAGTARDGGMMGLRLGGRDSWPPASSELRLALMGVLADSYLPQGAQQQSQNPRGGRQHMPGDLSFAVRDLSDNEIDRCMDPSGLEALDFLRLSYKPPAPLASIITPVILVKYDKIFRLMLRILRMIYFTSQLFRDTNARTSRWHDIDNAVLRFRIEAQHFVSSITAYFFDTGIGMPWARFETWLDKIQLHLESEQSGTKTDRVISPDDVRKYHEQVLDEIMHSLLLRKRQQPVLKLLEDVFTLILQFSRYAWLEAQGKAKGLDAPSVGELYQVFKKKVNVFITVCRGLSEKGGPAIRQLSNEFATDEKKTGAMDGSTIDRLLLQLEMSGYYGGPRL